MYTFIFKLSLSLFFTSLWLFCYPAASFSAIISRSKLLLKLVVFIFKIIKISLAKALYGMLALIPANQVLVKDIQLEVVIQDGWLQVKEAKQTQKVSISL